MPVSSKIALSEAQLDELMLSCWNMRMATLNANSSINLTPMWFGWCNGMIYTFGRGQKVQNLRRNTECSIVVDRNEVYSELQAATFQGNAIILEDADAELGDRHLPEVRRQMGIKYAEGRDGRQNHEEQKEPTPYRSSASGNSNRWIVFTPKRLVSWDNFKLADLAKK